MNKTITSLLDDINKCCERLSIFYMTGGVIPHYHRENKKGKVPVADIYIYENDMDRLYDELNSDPPSNIEIRCYETEPGKAMDYGNTETTFIDFSSTQIQHSFCFHVSILPIKNTYMENNYKGITILNNNREAVCFNDDMLKNIKESYHKGIRVRIPENEEAYNKILYREKDTVSIREYTYGNCIMSESVSYRDIPIDFPEVLENTSRLKSSLNDSRIAFKQEKAHCDKTFDEIRDLFV